MEMEKVEFQKVEKKKQLTDKEIEDLRKRIKLRKFQTEKLLKESEPEQKKSGREKIYSEVEEMMTNSRERREEKKFREENRLLKNGKVLNVKDFNKLLKIKNENDFEYED